MSLPKGINLFKLMENSDLNIPKSFKDLPALEAKCRKSGYNEAADYLHNWRIFIEYHIHAEWNVPDELYR